MPPDLNRPTTLLVTCEHGGNDVPPALAAQFAELADLLLSHRGYDLGALGVAKRLATARSAPLRFSTVTRLLVDLNRSSDAPDLHCVPIRNLPAAERAELIRCYHEPHRRQIADAIAAEVEQGRRVLHVGVHSFTDVLDNVRRELDLALLFDPARSFETTIAKQWLQRLQSARPQWRHRFNEPYHGTDDGLTTWLRTRFNDDDYAGIEVELRQGLILTGDAQMGAGDLLAATLHPILLNPRVADEVIGLGRLTPPRPSTSSAGGKGGPATA